MGPTIICLGGKEGLLFGSAAEDIEQIVGRFANNRIEGRFI